MVLTGNKGSRFTLEIVGYEFPELSEDPYGYDLNWLVIDVEATDGSHVERFRGPYLLTTEVAALADWFEAAARGGELDPISFTEPALAFRRAEDASPALIVRLSEHGGDSDEFEVPLVVSAADLRSAAANLRGEQSEFPYRSMKASA